MSNPTPEALAAAERIRIYLWEPCDEAVSEVATLIDAAFAGLRERCEHRSVSLVYIDGEVLAAIAYRRPVYPGAILDWYAREYAFDRNRLTLGPPIDVVHYVPAALSPTPQSEGAEK